MEPTQDQNPANTPPPVQPAQPSNQSFSPQPAPATPATKPYTPISALAVAALVLGILSLLFGITPFVGATFGIIAVALALIAILKKKNGKKLALAGLITGAIGALLSGTFTFLLLTDQMPGFLKSTTKSTETMTVGEARSKALIDSKKSFEKGETARLGYFDVTVNSISEPYRYETTNRGDQLITINMTLKNNNEVSDYIKLQLKAGGTVYGASVKGLIGGSFQPGETMTGDFVFTTKLNATPTSIQFVQDDVFAGFGEPRKRLTWTLAL